MQIVLILKFGRQNMTEGVLTFFKPLEREMKSTKQPSSYALKINLRFYFLIDTTYNMS